MATRREMKVFWKHRHSYLKFKVAFNTFWQSSPKIWIRRWDWALEIWDTVISSEVKGSKTEFREVHWQLQGTNCPHSCTFIQNKQEIYATGMNPLHTHCWMYKPWSCICKGTCLFNCNYWWNTIFFLSLAILALFLLLGYVSYQNTDTM